jgi:two-component system LytT family response regulator
VCIVDDEELARRGIRARLQSHDDVTIVAECANGREAVTAIREHDPDLVFLDVQMPGLDGFDVVETIGTEAMPVVVFVTAYDEYALRAFSAHALDYILKPLDEERFRDTLDRARQRVAEQAAGQMEGRLADLMADRRAPEASESDPPERFVVKSQGRVRFVETDEIVWIEAAGDYVRLHTRDGTHLVRKTMKEMEAELDGSTFLRIHRSTIIRAGEVEEMRPYGSNNEYVVVLSDGSQRKLSRTYYDDVNEFFDGGL